MPKENHKLDLSLQRMWNKALYLFTGGGIVSRVYPGKKTVSVKGIKEHVQKLLVVSNLKELYAIFNEENHNIRKEVFLTFCTFRPKEA